MTGRHGDCPDEGRSIELAAAVNDTAVLAQCLASSPDVVSGALRLRAYEGFVTAGAAYNQALADSTADFVVFAHQDVYLPKGFTARLRHRAAELDQLDPDWAIAGPVGMDRAGCFHGQAWSSGLGRVTIGKTNGPVAIETLDELLLVLRRDCGVSFDPDLPGFHLYATDIVQTAKLRGAKSYVVDLPVVHHSRPIVALDRSYRRCYRYMQKKWRLALPIQNLVCSVHRSFIPLLIRDARIRINARGRATRKPPSGDPAAIARSLGWEAGE